MFDPPRSDLSASVKLVLFSEKAGSRRHAFDPALLK